MSQAANTFWINRFISSARIELVERRRLRSRRLIDGLIVMVILAASAICVSIYWRAESELAEAVAKREAAAIKLEELKVRVERREREVQQLKNDRAAIEQFARQRFGFVRPGDVVIRLPQNEEQTAAVRMANLTPQRTRSYTKASN